MPDSYLEIEGQLPEKQEKKKKKHWFRTVVDILIVIVFAIIIAISGTVIYLSVAFGEGFFVNGASMYPTLNSDGYTWHNIDGTQVKRPLTWNDKYNYAKGDLNLNQGDLVDYGYGISKPGFLNNVRRYDIVMTYYPGDYTDSTYTKLLTGATLKIKRVIGLPGEKISIVRGTAPENVWGTTTITNSEGTKVLDNLYTLDDFKPITVGDTTITYPYGGVFYEVHDLQLGDNEYFVCGDNRYHSQDSRSSSVGAIKSSMIKGQACLVTSLRQLEKNSSGDMVPKFRLDTIRMPWNYIDLRKH